MNFLFWLLWAFNLLGALFIALAAGFRGEMNLSTSTNGWLLLLFVAVMVAGLLLRFTFKFRTYGLWAVALPALVMVVWLLVEKALGKG